MGIRHRSLIRYFPDIEVVTEIGSKICLDSYYMMVVGYIRGNKIYIYLGYIYLFYLWHYGIMAFSGIFCHFWHTYATSMPTCKA